ncbi:MAG: DNA repair protein RecO, partial [Eubacterium sp.]|nr:DNA repair protein RecO [Eubacterium sp.]
MDLITDGIIFRQVKATGGRRMILLFTKKYGKISVGTSLSEKGKNRASLALRPFTFGSYQIYQGRNYYNLDRAETVKSFYGIGEDPDKYMSASYVLELTERVVPEEVPQPQIFQLLVTFMEELSERPKKP